MIDEGNSLLLDPNGKIFSPCSPHVSFVDLQTFQV